jgi:hypothetical protein
MPEALLVNKCRLAFTQAARKTRMNWCLMMKTCGALLVLAHGFACGALVGDGLCTKYVLWLTSFEVSFEEPYLPRHFY